MVRFPGGTRCSSEPTTARSAYDNERPRHAVDVAPFSIDVFPVTNGDFLEFIRDGGYARSELWPTPGRQWLAEAKVDAPKYWMRDGDDWCVRAMDDVPLRATATIPCVTCRTTRPRRSRASPESDCRPNRSGRSPRGGTACGERMRAFPWGDDAATPSHANVDQLSFATAPIGAYERNWSPLGCYGMIGDVWEWTSSDFQPYPGYETFPYPEYSQVFFGSEYKVLRGGSWATRPGAIRNSFRNWDYPIRRQIFSGLRCAEND